MRFLKEHAVGLVGISLVTDDFQKAVIATKAIKKSLGLPVIWGGAHVNVCPEECLEYVDMICMGEGEEALLELVNSLSDNQKPEPAIKNIWFKTPGGEILRNELRDLTENLEQFPLADIDPVTSYQMNERVFDHPADRANRMEYSIMTSRGCPYGCCYCYNNYRRKHYQGKGRYVRLRSIENVIQELSIAKAAYKDLKKINFWDDSFLVRDKEEFKKFAELYNKYIGIPFFILAEPMAFDEEKIGILKGCGLSQIQIGIQTGSERINKEVYNRKISNRRVSEIARSIDRLGLAVKYDVIFNNPYETREDIIRTIRLFAEFPKPYFIQGYNLIFYPGTQITENALRDGFISARKDKDDFTTIQGEINTPLLSKRRSVISSRFYSVNYDSGAKEYLNYVFRLLGTRYISRGVIEYFIRSETIFKRFFLKFLTKGYFFLSRIKNMVG